MDPGVTSHGIKADDPPGYLWSKYECFLTSCCWDIPHLRNFNIKLWMNSTNGTESRTNTYVYMDERTNRKTKTIYQSTFMHKCRWYNYTEYRIKGQTSHNVYLVQYTIQVEQLINFLYTDINRSKISSFLKALSLSIKVWIVCKFMDW